MADGQIPQANQAMEQLLLQFVALQQRLQQLEERPHQPPLANQAGQQPARAAAYDFGVTPEQVSTAFRELSDRIRAVPIPASTNINTTKPRGASTAAKAELDTMAKITSVARALLQLHVLHQREEIAAQQLAEALLTVGLHLTAILQSRQGDIFIESTFPDAYDTFRSLRAGPGGYLAGEELQRLTTAIQLVGSQQPNQQQHQQRRGGGPSRGSYNNYTRGGGPNNFSRGGYNNYNRGGFNHHHHHFNNNYNGPNNSNGGPDHQ